MKICEYCGKEFVPKQYRSKYCSRECSTKGFHQSRPKGGIKKCAWCGTEFITEHLGTKYCSPGCRLKAIDEKRLKSVENRKTKHEAKECLHCGKKFIPRDGRQIYCSKECSAQHHRVVYKSPAKEKIYKDRVCEECGEVFTPANSVQKYCSNQCYLESQYRSKRKPRALEEERKPKAPKRKMSPASKRFAKMSLREISAECARLHISYGKAQVAATNNTLPEDWGLHR